ncbi:response regulator [Marivirga sp. S37H4]|uniref:Response regulator n=1 Tax=Marivirga aurantiaca TaxID=2802615 RepID=A0A935C6P1_9BACT|nr:response regulator [Marivirga aurantiaca]MBK6264551.1 response regulator [Marivirga aurantiaca]
MKTKILVVDDFQIIRELLKSTLSIKGYEITTANNGKEALNVLNEVHDPYDLIISDYNMPEMNGYELLKQIRINPIYQYKPFILLTTEKDPQKMRDAKNAGVTAWIGKPYKLDAFLAQIKYVINKSKN